MFFLGVDIGGTKIEVVLVATEKSNIFSSSACSFPILSPNGTSWLGEILLKKRMPTERLLGYEQIIHKVTQLCKEVCQETSIGLNKISGIGLSLPGPVDPSTGLISVSNSMVFAGKNVQKDLSNNLSISCSFLAENDANCFALAEAHCGAGVDYYQQTNIQLQDQISIGLILGSGVGGGIVVSGKILKGRRGAAGELGHLTLYNQGLSCYCGKRGCVEQYLSGPALEGAFQARLYSQIQGRPNSSEIFLLQQQQDPIALAVVSQYKDDLATYLAQLTAALDPHFFVFGGGLSLQEEIYSGMKEKLTEKLFLKSQPPQILKHKLSDSAGAIGAILPLLPK